MLPELTTPDSVKETPEYQAGYKNAGYFGAAVFAVLALIAWAATILITVSVSPAGLVLLPIALGLTWCVYLALTV